MRRKVAVLAAVVVLAVPLAACDNSGPGPIGGGGGGGGWPIFLPWFMPSPSVTNHYNTPAAPRAPAPIVPLPKPAPAPAPKPPAPAPKPAAPAPRVAPPVRAK